MKSLAEQLLLSRRRANSPSNDTAAAGQPDESNIKVFPLRHTKASDAERLIGQLFPRDIQSVAADSRTNSVIVRGDPETLNVIFSILTRLDEPVEPAPSPATGTMRRHAEASASIETLKKQYESVDLNAAELARQLQDLRTAAWPDKTKIEKLSADLRRAVAAAFAARQRLHQAEIAQLQERLNAIQRDVEMRQKLSDQIIDRRVKDLLSPQTQWDSSTAPPAKAPTTTASTESTSRNASIGSSAKPNVFRGTWAERELEEMLKSLGLKVQKLTASEAPNARLAGAHRIVAIEPDSPAKELEVGDLIVGMQSTGLPGRQGRRIELHVRRASEQFVATVEFFGEQATWPRTPN